MRLLTPIALLHLLTLATAQEAQISLQERIRSSFQSLFSQAKSYNPSAATQSADITAAGLASCNVKTLTRTNWQSALTPSPTASSTTSAVKTYMVLISGGNKTCYGLCDRLEKAWNHSVAHLSTSTSAPSLAYINCDVESVLCAIWAAGPPAIWYIQRPFVGQSAGQSVAATDIHIVPLNHTTVTESDIVKIYTEETWRERPLYEGAFHPFDGWLAKAGGLNVPIGMILFGFGLVPSWAIMIGVSFASRSLMSVMWKEG